MLKHFITDESGQALTEYGLIIALVGITVIAAIAAMGNSTAEMIEDSAEAVENAGKNPGSAAAPDLSGQMNNIVDSAEAIVESAGGAAVPGL